MEKKLDIKYNIPNIKIFLSIFELVLEEKEDIDINSVLRIYMEDLEVGQVEFGEDEISINTLSKYGDIECKTNYSEAFTLTDIESYQIIAEMGLYASWHNSFNFKLNLLNGTIFNGNLHFDVRIDNEFGNRVTPHFNLKYKDGDKEYYIKFQLDGSPFHFIEKRGFFEEEIIYDIFNTWGNGAYIHHSKSDQFTDGINNYNYYERALISDSMENKSNNTAVIYKVFDEKWIVHNYREFCKLSNDNNNVEEIIHKANFMSLIDPSINKRIHRLIEEFSVDGTSFMEKLFIYGFSNYSNEEVFSLFKLNKNDTDLEKLYFGKENFKSIGSKIFLPKQENQ